MAVTIRGSGQVPTQAVQTVKTDTWSESVAAAGTSGDVTGLTATITPVNSANRVLVTVSVSTSCPSNPVFVKLFINGALSAFVGDTASNRVRCTVSGVQVDDDKLVSNCFSFLHSTNSVSAQTYSIRLSHASGVTRTIYVNRTVNDADNTSIPRTASSIELAEIAYA